VVIVWIVLAVIAAGMFSEWIGLRKEQARLGAGVADSDTRLDALRQELEAEQERLRRRIEHLEAIVTDEAWDARTPSRAQLDLPPAEELPEERAAGQARRLRS
jgi:hypothetical protein